MIKLQLAKAVSVATHKRQAVFSANFPFEPVVMYPITAMPAGPNGVSPGVSLSLKLALSELALLGPAYRNSQLPAVITHKKHQRVFGLLAGIQLR